MSLWLKKGVPLSFMHRSLQCKGEVSINLVEEDQFLSSFIRPWKPSRISFQMWTCDVTYPNSILMGYIKLHVPFHLFFGHVGCTKISTII